MNIINLSTYNFNKAKFFGGVQNKNFHMHQNIVNETFAYGKRDGFLYCREADEEGEAKLLPGRVYKLEAKVERKSRPSLGAPGSFELDEAKRKSKEA
jgi:hypothetical protein